MYWSVSSFSYPLDNQIHILRLLVCIRELLVQNCATEESQLAQVYIWTEKFRLLVKPGKQGNEPGGTMKLSSLTSVFHSSSHWGLCHLVWFSSSPQFPSSTQRISLCLVALKLYLSSEILGVLVIMQISEPQIHKLLHSRSRVGPRNLYFNRWSYYEWSPEKLWETLLIWRTQSAPSPLPTLLSQQTTLFPISNKSRGWVLIKWEL